MTSNNETAPRRNFLCVQALRAVAAGLVVTHHSISLWLDWIIHKPGQWRWINGAGGVDLFFVISGFVMAISLPALAARENRAAVFLKRRIVRVVPLYWTAITFKLWQVWSQPGMAAAEGITRWRIVASYVFIPTRDGKGGMFPIVTVGWTLNFEAFFYLLFAAALAMDIAPLALLTPCLTALALAGVLKTGALWNAAPLASPIVIEFLYGMLIAEVVRRGRAPGRVWGWALLGGGFAALMTMRDVPAPWGSLTWGLSAGAIVLGAVALEDWLGRRLPRWLLGAGDASYAMYLSHTFVLWYVAELLNALHVTGTTALAGAIVLGLAVSYATATVVHRYIEKPLMRLFASKPVPAVVVEATV
jgi:peptidoglycan/LPS O-acetylase OafA/YrhL